jgi:hypothetical protein
MTRKSECRAAGTGGAGRAIDPFQIFSEIESKPAPWNVNPILITGYFHFRTEKNYSFNRSSRRKRGCRPTHFS